MKTRPLERSDVKPGVLIRNRQSMNVPSRAFLILSVGEYGVTVLEFDPRYKDQCVITRNFPLMLSFWYLVEK